MENEFEIYQVELDNYNEWLENIVKIEPVSIITGIKIKRADGYELDLTEWKHPRCMLPKFFLTDIQTEKYEKWRKTLPKKDFGAAGGGTSFYFTLEGKITFKITPTGIGIVFEVKSKEGFEIDITDWDNF
jgi:hypothetical protein